MITNTTQHKKKSTLKLFHEPKVLLACILFTGKAILQPGKFQGSQHAPLRATDDDEAKKDGSVKTDEGLKAQAQRTVDG